jgi:hypothetical protein
MKKKMKRFEKGGSIDEGVRARAMAAMASQLRDETGEVSSIRRNQETGELYDTAMPKPRAAVKKAVKKSPPPDSSNEDYDRMRMNELPESLRAPGFTPSSVIKKPARPTRENTDVSDMTYSTDSPERTYKAPKVAPQAAPKAEPKPKKIRGTNRENTNVSDMTYPMKKGGMVSSASKRADGCAIRGKTRA